MVVPSPHATEVSRSDRVGGARVRDCVPGGQTTCSRHLEGCRARRASWGERPAARKVLAANRLSPANGGEREQRHARWFGNGKGGVEGYRIRGYKMRMIMGAILRVGGSDGAA